MHNLSNQRLYSQEHTSSLIKVGARIAEAKEFVLSYDTKLSQQENVQAAFHQRWFGNASIDVCKRFVNVFSSRFHRLPGQLDSIRTFLQWGEPEVFPLINHFFLVLADPYYRWIAGNYLAQRFTEYRLEVRRDVMEQELRELVPLEITNQSVNRIARNGLTALRDNGFLEGQTKKRIASPRLPVSMVGFMLYTMNNHGVGANHFDESLVFASLLKPKELFVPLFQQGERLGWWEFTGDRTRLTANLHYGSLEDWLKDGQP